MTLSHEQFTSRIIKGGALIEETHRLVEAWRPEADLRENLVVVTDRSSLAKLSRSRAQDVMEILEVRIITQRPEVVRTLRLLASDPRAFREACYYEAARADALLRAFAQEALFCWYQEGRLEASVADVIGWLRSDPRAPSWGEQTRDRVAQGLLSALRDFGILKGAARGRRKWIAQPQLGMKGFAYVALRERPHHLSDRSLVESSLWRSYLLSPESVRRLFLEADRLGILRFAEVGTALRIDWLIKDLEEISRVFAA